jgi:hypothetical protein
VRGFAARGVATREALAAQLPALGGALRRLAALPTEGTPTSGPQYALAALAALLRVREPSSAPARSRADMPSDDAGGGIEGALARAAHAAAHGRLGAAADEVERGAAGSAAAHAAAPWVQAARERAAAEQALQMLRAHCELLTAALSAPDVRE